MEESARREQEEAAKAVEISPAVKEEEPVKEHVEEPLRPAPEQTDARMTKEQLSELAEALSILTAKSSIVKERDELKSLLEDNLLSEAVSFQKETRRIFFRKLMIWITGIEGEARGRQPYSCSFQAC